MATKFGLGKGLADLKAEMGNVPEISVLTGGERVVVRNIPLSQIAPNPDQPRKSFKDAELAELASSIREKGVLQPILVRSVANRPHPYEIVAGERRYRASQMAGLSEIPALVKTLSEPNAMEIALIENVQRENLNAIEESDAYHNLMQRAGYTIEDVSKLIGKSISYLRNILRLSALPGVVKEMVKSGELSPSHARTIAVAADPESLAREIIGKNLSVADTANLTRGAGRSSKSRSFNAKTMKITDKKSIEKSIEKHIGTRAIIREKKHGAGEIALLFSNRAEMNHLITKLSK